jgi:hypothetical protein
MIARPIPLDDWLAGCLTMAEAQLQRIRFA